MLPNYMALDLEKETMTQIKSPKLLSSLQAVFIFLITSMAFSAEVSQHSDSAAQRKLTEAQVIVDVALAKEAYERIHPGYTRYTDNKEIETAWQNILQIAKIKRGLTVGDLYLQVQKTLALIHCDHTKANLPKALEKERDTQPIYLPFRWTWLENRAFITISDGQGIIAKNDELLSLDGESIQILIEQVLPYIPYDGHTTWSRLSGVAESLEFKSGALDHFGALLWDIEPTAELIVKTQGGEIKAMQVQRINYQQWVSLDGNNTRVQNFKDAVKLERIGENIAYLRLDTFVNYRQPYDPNDIYDPVFKIIQQDNIDVLIIDLRHNGGGSTDASHGLLANLITQPTRAKLDMRAKTLNMEGLREHLWTWDERALDPYRIAFSQNDDNTYSLRSWLTDDLDTIKPAKYAFDGKIIALTSHGNSSGSTNLLANIQALGRSTLIGEKPGAVRKVQPLDYCLL